MHILILDDEPTIAKGISTIIQKMDKTYVETINWFYKSEDALDHLKKHSVDLILTDIQMPALDGLSFIDTVKVKWPDIFFIVVSGFDMFNYVNSAYQKGVLEYLRKPISRDKLSVLLDTVHQKMVENTLHNTEATLSHLFESDEASYKDFLCRNPEWLKQAIPLGYHFVVAIQGSVFHKSRDLACSLKKQLPFSVHIFHINISALCIYLITVERPEYMADVETMLMNLCPDVEGAISLCSPEAAEVRSLYLGATQTIKYRMFYPANTLIHESEVSGGRQTTYPDLLGICNSLVKLCTSHQDEKLMEQILFLFSRDNLQKYNIYAIEQLYYTVLNSLITLYPKSSPSVSEPPPLSAYHNPEELAKYVLSFFKGVQQDENFNFRTDIQKKVSLYIEQHYMENLTLAMVSNHVSVSYNYFSKLFHDMFSTSFSDYLCRIRMEHARDLLMHSNLNISEISKKVGYSNPKHFSRMFKNFYGQSPASFKKS